MLLCTNNLNRNSVHHSLYCGVVDNRQKRKTTLSLHLSSNKKMQLNAPELGIEVRMMCFQLSVFA